MAVKSGASHGVAAVSTYIIGAILTDTVTSVLPPVGQISLFLTSSVRALLGIPIPISEYMFGSILIILPLSVAWGVGYHIKRHG